ncbi:MAG: calcium-binding protein, partial [Paracoccaceae bacterium]
SAFDNAITMTDNAFLNVLGSVFGGLSGVQSARGGYVAIGATGVILGSGIGLNFSAASFGATVNNKGVIYGGTGVSIVNQNGIVTNTGQITGDSGNGIQFSGSNTLRLTNSGDIFGSFNGIESTGTTTSVIANSGIISGVNASLSLSNGISLVTNTGLLDGRVVLGGGADVFNGAAGVQGDVFGGNGVDRIIGGLAEERLFGGNDADVIRGNGGDDSLDGGDAADLLFGGAGDDTVIGGIGLDTLRGNEGDDRLTGGTLADTFVFTRNQGTDIITDFQNNVDKLDLRAFDLGTVAAVAALSSASAFGLRIDLPGEGMLFVTGLTLAQLDAADLLL